MEVKFYKTKSSNNTIGKHLENETIFEIFFKDRVDIQQPIVRLQVDSFDGYNYCYIPKFDRYYFIEDITIERTGIYTLRMSVDVLESFKRDIMNSKATVIQKEKVNPYYDSGYKSEVRKEIDIYESDVELEMEDSMIVTVVGGVF